MASIDERVVEMRFDNSQFESGVKTSLKTIDNLKASLNGLDDSAQAFDTIDKSADNVDLSALAKSVEALENRFSTLGIVSMRVIENITDALMGTVSNAVSYASDKIISGGLKRAQNIENAHFQLQALLKDESKVQAVMDNAMESVSDTAYAYDEAAKAAAQFSASGIEAGDDMVGALRGIVGVASMTNSEYESISRIFTTVAGNGRLMGDQLLQLSSRGLNAASTIASYFQEVQGQSDVTEAKVREMVSSGEISFQTFAAAMNWAFGDQAFRANETFNGVVANIGSAFAKIGAGFFSPLIEQNSDLILMLNSLKSKINEVKTAVVFDELSSAIDGIQEKTWFTEDAITSLFSTIKDRGTIATSDLQSFSEVGVSAIGVLKKYIEGVKDGSIRASYAVREEVNALSTSMVVTDSMVERFVENGEISYATLLSAMENYYGTSEAVSKQFTEFFLDNMAKLKDWLDNLDLSTAFELFYYGLETIKNLFKGLWTIVKPIGEALVDVFGGSDVEKGMENFADRLQEITSTMRLSEESSNNLKDAFTGIFNVVKLLITGVAKLFGVSLDLVEPTGSLLDLLISLLGYAGRGLTKLTEWISNSKVLGYVWDGLTSAFQYATKAISSAFSTISETFDYLYNLPEVQNALKAIDDAFYEFQDVILSVFTEVGDTIDTFWTYLSGDIFPGLLPSLEDVSAGVADIADDIKNMDLEKLKSFFSGITDAVQKLKDDLKANEGLQTFVESMVTFGENIADAFTFDKACENIEKLKSTLEGVVEWIKTNVLPLFSGTTISGAVGTIGGIAIIKAVYKEIKAFEKLGNDLAAIPNLMNSFKGVLTEYQKNLKADSILKIAEAIAVLVGTIALSITILSFTDLDKAARAADIIVELIVVLVGTAALLAYAVSKLIDSMNKGNALEKAINNFAKGIKNGINNLTKAVKWKAIASTIKSIGETLLMIVASILLLAYAYSKNGEAMDQAVGLLAIIAACLAMFILILSTFGEFGSAGLNAFSKASSGILEVSAALLLIVIALNKLFGMEIPADWQTKCLILLGLVTLLGALIIAMGIAGSFSKGSLKIAGTLLAICVVLYTLVSAIDKLFKMELPSDYQKKFDILYGIFIAIALLILIMGVASNLSGGKGLKAGGTLLAMAVVIGVIVAALMVLQLFDSSKMLQASVELGIILVALGIALGMAGEISDKNTWKAILAMCLMIGTIVAALAVLTILDTSKMLLGAVALAAVLLAVAAGLYAAGQKEVKSKTLIAILEMALIVGEIAACLYILSTQPWTGLLAAAAAMSVVMLTFTEMLSTISKKTGLKQEKMVQVLEASLVLIPIAACLYFLSEKPWTGMLAAAVAMSAVLLALAESFKIISSTKEIDKSVLKAFFVGLIAVIVIGYTLYELASQPWEGLLASAAAISGVLIAMAAAFDIMAVAGEKINGTLIGAFIGGAVGIAIIGEIIGYIAGNDWESLLAAGTSISLVLMTLAVVMYICSLVGPLGKKALVGMGVLDAFIVDLAAILAALGALTKIDGFADAIANGGEVFASLGNALGKFIGSIIGGFGEGLSNSFPAIGQNLSDFASNASYFIWKMKQVDESVFSGTKILVDAITKLSEQTLVNKIKSFLGLDLASSTLGDDFKALGKAVSGFSEEVKDINAGKVKAAAYAAETIAALYDGLPKEGGWLSKITGSTKSMGDFADDMKDLGKGIKSYSDSIGDGINEDAVQSSVNAAKILSDFQDNLPNIGGLQAKIFGDQTDLGTFGEQLKSFGTALVTYCVTVAGLVVEPIQRSVDAATLLSDLQNSLGNEGGVVAFFTGDNDLSTFGKNLVDFGNYLVAYTTLVGEIDMDSLDNSIAEVKKLISMSKSMEGMDTSVMSGFGQALTDMGNNGMQGLIDAFANGIENVTNQISLLVNTCLMTFKANFTPEALNPIGQNILKYIAAGITQYQPTLLARVTAMCKVVMAQFRYDLPSATFNTIGQNVLMYISAGMSQYQPTLLAKVAAICKAVIDKFTSDFPEKDLNKIGSNVIQYLIDGMDSRKDDIKTEGSKLAKAALKGIKSALDPDGDGSYKPTYEVGQYAALGLSEGINSKIDEIAKAATASAVAAIQAAKEATAEASPSKVFRQIGAYMSLGMALGIGDESDTVADASESMAYASISAVSSIVDAISEIIDDDFEPTITPVLDLSKVQSGLDYIDNAFDDQIQLATYDQAMAADESLKQSRNSKSEEKSDKSGDSVVNNNYNFVQNNTSPKALSRIEIYRQTRNQFTRFKEAMG